MWKYVAFWFVLAVVAFINGTLRAVVYGKALGEPWAHHVSVVLGILLTGGAIWLFCRKWPFASQRQAVVVGLLWLLMTEVFEVVMVVGVMQKGWTAFLQMHKFWRGESWPVFLLWIALAPVLFERWQRNKR